jgi:2-keto-4-pentenoate hydratase
VSVERGTAAMLTRRREILAQGAEPIGWKVGFNVPEMQRKLGLDAPLAGFLTTDSLVEGDWSIEDDGPVVVESEVAVELGDDARSVVALLAALELTDPPDLDIELEQILAGNIFHRAVAFGPRVEGTDPGAGRILVNGEETPVKAGDLSGMVEAVAARLEAAGDQLQPGDRIITGVLAPPHEAKPGDTVRLEFDELGSVELRFS